MGQAKQRGTRAQRIEAAIARRSAAPMDWLELAVQRMSNDELSAADTAGYINYPRMGRPRLTVAGAIALGIEVSPVPAKA